MAQKKARAKPAGPAEFVHRSPASLGRDWLAWVQSPQTEAELTALRRSVQRGAPYGSDRWKKLTARRLGLESPLASWWREAATCQSTLAQGHVWQSTETASRQGD